MYAVYVRDFRCGRVKVFCLEQKFFSEPLGPHFMNTLVAAISNLLPGAFDNNLSESVLNALGKCLIDYIRSTETYRLWRGKSKYGDRLHAVINVYPGGGSPLLRPFILNAVDTILSPEEIIRASLDVSQMDHRKHPDWF